MVSHGFYLWFTTGLFMVPTVLTNVQDHMFVAQEESFGPIMVVSKFSSRLVNFTFQHNLRPFCNSVQQKSPAGCF